MPEPARRPDWTTYLPTRPSSSRVPVKGAKQVNSADTVVRPTVQQEWHLLAAVYVAAVLSPAAVALFLSIRMPPGLALAGPIGRVLIGLVFAYLVLNAPVHSLLLVRRLVVERADPYLIRVALGSVVLWLVLHAVVHVCLGR